MCGLLKRDNLPDVDIGYAYLPEYWGQGYAFEAAAATLRHAARASSACSRVIGVVSPGNTGSIRVLEKLGMRFERMYAMHPGEPEVRLYGLARRRGPEPPHAGDRVADHLADLRAGVDAQFHGPIEAQFTVDHAGGADVHLDGFVLAPVPARSHSFFLT